MPAPRFEASLCAIVEFATRITLPSAAYTPPPSCATAASAPRHGQGKPDGAAHSPLHTSRRPAYQVFQVHHALQVSSCEPSCARSSWIRCLRCYSFRHIYRHRTAEPTQHTVHQPSPRPQARARAVRSCGRAHGAVCAGRTRAPVLSSSTQRDTRRCARCPTLIADRPRVPQMRTPRTTSVVSSPTTSARVRGNRPVSPWMITLAAVRNPRMTSVHAAGLGAVCSTTGGDGAMTAAAEQQRAHSLKFMWRFHVRSHA